MCMLSAGLNCIILFSKHILSMGSMSCSSCKCLKYSLCVPNGSCAGDKTASLYQGCIKDNARGCFGPCNNSSEIKDVKKLVEAMWKWLQRAVVGGGAERMFAGLCMAHSLQEKLQVDPCPLCQYVSPPQCVKVVVFSHNLHIKPSCVYFKTCNLCFCF